MIPPQYARCDASSLDRNNDVSSITFHRHVANGIQLVQAILCLINVFSENIRYVELFGFPFIGSYWLVLGVWTASLPLVVDNSDGEFEGRLRVLVSWLVEVLSFSRRMAATSRNVKDWLFLAMGVPIGIAIVMMQRALERRYSHARVELSCVLWRNHFRVFAGVGVAMALIRVATWLDTSKPYHSSVYWVTALLSPDVLVSGFGVFVLFHSIQGLSMDGLKHRVQFSLVEGCILLLQLFGVSCVIGFVISNHVFMRVYHTHVDVNEDGSNNYWRPKSNDDWEWIHTRSIFYLRWQRVGLMVWCCTVVLWLLIAHLAAYCSSSISTTTSISTATVDLGAPSRDNDPRQQLLSHKERHRFNINDAEEQKQQQQQQHHQQQHLLLLLVPPQQREAQAQLCLELT